MTDKKKIKKEKFIKLQNKWYAKLSKSGFVDLEWYCQKTGQGHSSPFLRDSLNKFKHLEASELVQTAKYFIDAQAFTSHHTFPSRLHKFMWEMFASGLSYRKMIPEITSRGFKHVPSIFWISIELNKLKQDFWAWQVSQDDEGDGESLSDFIELNRGSLE